MSVKDLLQSRIIDPIKSQCPESVPMDAYLQLIFNVHRRGISRYRVTSDTEIPGLYCVNGCLPIQGVGDEWRLLKRLKHIWVRHDDDLDIYHVDNKGHVYLLTADQWTQLRSQLVVAGKNVEV